MIDNKKSGSEVAGFFVFSHIWIIRYFGLGYVRVKECPEGARYSGKVIVKKRRNSKLRTIPMSKNFFLLLFISAVFQGFLQKKVEMIESIIYLEFI